MRIPAPREIVERFSFFIARRKDLHMIEVVSGASAAFALKVLSALLAFVFNVILARKLGADGAGLFFLGLSVVMIGSVFGRVGLDSTILRFVASHASVDDWVSVKGIYTKGMKIALASSAVVSVVIFIFAPLLSTEVFSEPQLTPVMRWMAAAIIPYSLFMLHAEALKGLKRIRGAVSVQSVIVSAVGIPCVLIFIPLFGVRGAALGYTLACAGTLMAGFFLWKRASTGTRLVTGRFETSVLVKTASPIFWGTVMQLFITWTSTIMLGVWSTKADVGIFSIALRTATLTSFVLIAVNSIAAPKFAALYRQGDMKALASTARDCAKLMVILATPILLVFILLPSVVMGLFGSRFSQDGAMVLSILAVGQFVNVATGSVGYLLLMCGHERMLKNALIVSAALNLALSYVLIHRFGLLGAAISTAVVLSFQNLLAAWFVFKKLGIVTIPVLRSDLDGRVD